MQTSVKNPVVAPFAEFLAVASTSEVKNHYNLSLSNTLTGRSASLLMSSVTCQYDLPRDPEHLLNEFQTMLCTLSLFGFKNFEEYKELLIEHDLELETVLETIEDYNKISSLAASCLYVIGSVDRLEALQELELT